LTFRPDRDPAAIHPELKQYLDCYSIDFSRKHEASYRLGFISAIGFEIATHYWSFELPRGTVFLFHDHFDHTGLFRHLIDWCLKEHYNVVSIDFPGHGLSSGQQANIETFDQYGEILKTLFPLCRKRLESPYFCIAHGAGAASVMNLMWKHGKRPFAKMVFLAPLVRPKDWSTLRYRLARMFGTSVKRSFLDDSSDKKFIEFLRTRDPLQSKRAPVEWTEAMQTWLAAFPSRPKEIMRPLVIQGDHDIAMEWRYNMKQMKAHFPNGTIAILKGGNHRLANETERVRAATFGKIKAYLDQAHQALSA